MDILKRLWLPNNKGPGVLALASLITGLAMAKGKVKSLLLLVYAAGCLLFWLFFRPLMIALAIWPAAARLPMDGQANPYVLQLISVLYLLMTNIPFLLAIFLPAALFGFWLLRFFIDKQESGSAPVGIGKGKWAQIFFLSLGLGLLSLSLLTLLLGLAHLLYRAIFVVLLILISIPGLISLVRKFRSEQKVLPPADTEHPGTHPLLYVLIPMAALALLAALVPAGILWDHDGRGYDVLEYHLQLPREYIAHRAIIPLDHNAYSNFPANTEMLYLIALLLKGDAVDGMYLAQLLNLILAILLIVGLYVFLRDIHPAGAALAAVGAAGLQFFYVATNAYVEPYMLLLFLLGLAAARAMPVRFPLKQEHLLAGIFTGGACGCKFTAVIQILPVAALFILVLHTCRFRRLFLFLVAVLAVLSPWLLRNTAWCGNPVFPIAARQLGQDHWSDEQVQRWQAAHRAKPEPDQVSPDQSALPQRLKSLAVELISPSRYGFAVLLALAVILAGIKKPLTAIEYLAIAALAIQLAVWLFLTHLQPRFLLPLLIPLALLTARRFTAVTPPPLRYLVMLFAIVTAAAHTLLAASRYNQNTSFNSPYGFHPLAGWDQLIESQFPFADSEAAIEPGTRLLMVGDARPFYVRCEYAYNTVFDRCYFAEHLAEKSPAEVIGWLQEENFTHLYINWYEVERLQKSYQFAPGLTRQNVEKLEQAGLIPLSSAEWQAIDSYYRLYRIPPR